MEPHASILVRLLATLLFIIFYTLPPLVQCQIPLTGDSEIRTYIVHVKKPEGAELLGGEKLEEHLKRWHLSFLPNATLDSGEPRLVYSYTHAISGFAAKLSAEEVAAMDGIEGFLYALPDRNHSLATTYTPDFLGLRQPPTGAWSRSSRGEGIIIAVLDGGILRKHLSFAYGTDEEMPDPPAKWKGSCELNICNKKLIGAISFVKSEPIPWDRDGHGTHVAGIAVGAAVEDAGLYGMAGGTASGTAPGAHLAVYKVCHDHKCSETDVLAAINQAIKDGVDVINLSLGFGRKVDFHADNIAIGSLSAVRKGIVVVAAAGNAGPEPETLGNTAPWLLVVGATSTDRRIRATVTLGGSGEEILGEAVYFRDATTGSTPAPVLPIAYPDENGDDDARYCKSFSGSAVTGKIVLCRLPYKGDPLDIALAVEKAGGAATIIMNGEKHAFTTQVAYTPIPASFVSFADGRRIVSYFLTSQSSGSSPTASIALDGTRFGHRPSPALASFSSRGPAAATGGILKPDVLAPGVNILSASHFGWDDDDDATPSARRFWFMSGTSMASPHVAGIAALIKGKHPQWSPAAIQSAIITSASNLDLDGNFIVDEKNTNLAAGIFDTGAGQVNASGAIDPGLIYDFQPKDYTGYLCGLGYTDDQVQAVLAGDHVECSQITETSAGQLNYPSIAWEVGPAPRTIMVTRTVTNVGEPSSVYVAKITEPEGVRVQVSPHELQFQWLQQTATFSVTLTVKSSHIHVGGSSSGGKIQWVSEKHIVTSPIAVLFKKAKPPTPSTTDVV